jgi:anaerobic magnesium-protoporphyrin IX monomethyl ester cyclase
MDVALVTAPSPKPVPLFFKNSSPGIGILLSCLRQDGFRAEPLDAYLYEMKPQQIAARLVDESPALVGFALHDSASLRTVAESIEALREADYRGHITVGGYLPTVAPRELLKRWAGIDSVLCGEADRSLSMLAGAVLRGSGHERVPGIAFRDGNGGVIEIPVGLPVQDLDKLPDMARDDLPYILRDGARVAEVSTSRGCHGRCAFCAMPPFYTASRTQGWRFRSAERLLAEILTLRSSYGARVFHFTDENFMGGPETARQRSWEFIRLVKSSDLECEFYINCRADDIDPQLFRVLREIGLAGVFLGLESGVQSVLQRFEKRLSVDTNRRAIGILTDLGIDFFPAYIMIDPHSSLGEFRDNLRFLVDNDLPVHPGNILSRLEVIPATKMQFTLEQEGRLEGNFWEGYYYLLGIEIERLLKILTPALRPLHLLVNWLDEALVMHWTARRDPLVALVKRRISREALALASEAAGFVESSPEDGGDDAMCERLRRRGETFAEEMNVVVRTATEVCNGEPSCATS